MSEIDLRQIDYSYSPDDGRAYAEAQLNLRGLQTPAVDYETLIEVISQANDSYDVIKGPQGYQFETAIFGNGPNRVVKPSTSFSSLYKNPGNALETAVEAAISPGSSIVYVGSLGNHPTSHRAPEELEWIRKTGRRTTGDGSKHNPYRPLRSLDSMAVALHNNGLDPKYIKADAEAGREALGLMVAFEADSIEQAFLNGLDGISKSAHYARSRLVEDAKSRIHRRAIKDGQPGELTPVNIKDVKRRMPNVYKGLGRIAHLAPLPLLLFPADDKEKFFVHLGNRSHNDLSDLDNHAVRIDMGAALLNQDATISVQANSESPEHNVDDCVEFGEIVMNDIPPELRTDNRRIRFIFGQGGLDAHTDNPHENARIVGHILPNIMSKIMAYGEGRRSKPPRDIDAVPVEQAA